LHTVELLVYIDGWRLVMKVTHRKTDRPPSEKDAGTAVISFRAPLELVRKLDELADDDYRNRANFILTTLVRATSEELVRSGEFWLKAFHEYYAKDPIGRETEFYRGRIAGWKRTLVAAYGASTAEKIIFRASETAKLPMPHAGTLSPEGRGYEGFDSFCHVTR
jgi:hypothetical protein